MHLIRFFSEESERSLMFVNHISLIRHAMFVMQELFDDYEDHEDDLVSLKNFIIRAYCFECDNAKRIQEREDDYDTLDYDDSKTNIFDDVRLSIFEHIREFYKTNIDITDDCIEEAIRRACCQVCCECS